VPIDSSFDLDLRQLDKGFAAMIRAAKNLKPVWRRIQPMLETDQLEHFTEQAGSGGAWPPLSASTLGRRKSNSSSRAKRRGRNPPKRTSGKIFGNKMPSAFEILMWPREIAAISKIEWADVHQFGGTAGRGAKIPQREHLWLSERFLARALPEIRKFVCKKFGRSAA
jgi:phage gpG-like protein